MSEIIDHLEKFRDNLNKLNGKIEPESNYGTKIFSQTHGPSNLNNPSNFSKTQPTFNLFQNEVKTLVEENNTLRKELKKIMSEQIEEDLDEKNIILPTERTLAAEKKQNLAEEMCGVAMERVDQLEEEMENMKNLCDVPGLFNQLNKIQFEYRTLFEGQNEMIEQAYEKLQCAERENKFSAIQIEDYHRVLENIRSQVKEKSIKLEDIQEIKMIYDNKIDELCKQAELDLEKIQNQELQLNVFEKEISNSREIITKLQQEIESFEESRECLLKENKKQKEILNNFEVINLKLRQDLAQKDQEIDSYKKNVKDIIQEGKMTSKQQINTERQKHDQDVSTTKNENIRLSQEVAELRTKLASERDHYDKMQTEEEKAKREITDQVQQLCDVRNKQNKQISQLSSAKQCLLQENEKLKEKMKQILGRKNEESKSFEKEILNLNNRLKLAESEKTHSQEDFVNLIEHKNNSLDETRNELRNKNKECIRLKSKLSSLVDQLKDTKIEAETRVEQQILEKESIIEEMNNLLQEEQKMSKRWKNDYERIVAQNGGQIEAIIQENKNLNRHNASLRNTNKKYEQEILEREDLIKRHQTQYLEAQKEILKFRKIMKGVQRNDSY